MGGLTVHGLCSREECVYLADTRGRGRWGAQDGSIVEILSYRYNVRPTICVRVQGGVFLEKLMKNIAVMKDER